MKHEEIVQILEDVTYKDWEFEYRLTDEDTQFRIRFEDSEEEEPQYGRWWIIEDFRNTSQIVQTALKAILAAEEHEAREVFRYRGIKVFNPHIDVDVLCEVASKKANLALPV